MTATLPHRFLLATRLLSIRRVSGLVLTGKPEVNCAYQVSMTACRRKQA
jgi:hypothetical protein